MPNINLHESYDDILTLCIQRKSNEYQLQACTSGDLNIDKAKYLVEEALGRASRIDMKSSKSVTVQNH